MNVNPPQPGAPRALTADDLQAIRRSAGPGIGMVVDGATHGGAGRRDPLDFAADQIVAAITGGNSPIIAKVLQLGLGLDAAAVGTLGFFQRIFAIQRICALSFPNAEPLAAMQMLVEQIVGAGVPFSVVASGTTTSH